MRKNKNPGKNTGKIWRQGKKGFKEKLKASTEKDRKALF